MTVSMVTTHRPRSHTAAAELGGIYALERIAHDSARDHPTVMEVLSAYVREHPSLALSGTYLTNADLTNMELTNANLTGANLINTDLFSVK